MPKIKSLRNVAFVVVYLFWDYSSYLKVELVRMKEYPVSADQCGKRSMRLTIGILGIHGDTSTRMNREILVVKSTKVLSLVRR